MQTITTIGLDIAKSVFQVHGVDAAGQVVIRRQLKRRHVLAFFQKRALLTPGPSDRAVTSRPGLGSFPDSIQVAARSGSAASVNRVTAICAACSWPEHWLLFAMPKSMVSGIGLG